MEKKICSKCNKEKPATVEFFYRCKNGLYCICKICDLLPKWKGKLLVLRLDHINGDHYDNRLFNLRLVCPNCDSQLPTFCGRNVKHRKLNGQASVFNTE